ncbi:hypothetical protein PSACC_00666 [Paramicrosporidium saccamoebae]|uniref:Uncharacterized protein n=1 Tax=Paramicrosporidium saccamoebae TaxID=1246581 RepID=A0A2H9TP62_9FUNG|nr:hypothetical protein PSACC_00666 [Paramicrosporidium saccamoebae]
MVKGAGKPSAAAKPKAYKPKHSFAKLISDGTGPRSVLADDGFWKYTHDSDRKSELEEPDLDCLGSEDPALECPKDTGVPFPTMGAGSDCKDGVVKIARILLGNHHVSSFMAEQLLDDGLLEEQCVGSGRANRCVKYMASLIECSADPKRNRAGFNLCMKLVKSAQGRATDKLWSAFNLLNMITRQNFRLTLDKEISRTCWIELSQTFEYVVTWLDMDRIHLIIDWIRAEQDQVLSEHCHRPIQVAKLLNGSSLGQLAGKIIIDCFLWQTKGGGACDVCVGDDYEFIVTLTKLLDQNPDTASADAIRSLYSTLCLASARLHLTFFEGEYKRECEALLASLNPTCYKDDEESPGKQFATRMTRNHSTDLGFYLPQGRQRITTQPGCHLTQN